MSKIFAGEMGRQKPSFRASHLASSIVAGPWEVVREEVKVGEGGRNLLTWLTLPASRSFFIFT
jgi:hypothetical protein